MIAYRKDAFGDNGPSNWAEFWDLENFPGKRGMHGKVNYNLEAALMADGVPMADIYDTLATDEGKARAWANWERSHQRSPFGIVAGRSPRSCCVMERWT